MEKPLQMRKIKTFWWQKLHMTIIIITALLAIQPKYNIKLGILKQRSNTQMNRSTSQSSFDASVKPEEFRTQRGRPQIRLDSPRFIEACYELGVDPESLAPKCSAVLPRANPARPIAAFGGPGVTPEVQKVRFDHYMARLNRWLPHNAAWLTCFRNHRRCDVQAQGNTTAAWRQYR